MKKLLAKNSVSNFPEINDYIEARSSGLVQLNIFVRRSQDLIKSHLSFGQQKFSFNLEDDNEETDENNRAAKDEKAFLDARNTILMQYAPVYPINYNKWNLCDDLVQQAQ